MSNYEVQRIGWLVLHDHGFRERLTSDPAAALDQLDLEPDEREALLRGDVGWLYERGAHEYLLWNLARFGALGLNPPTFSERIRAARARPASL